MRIVNFSSQCREQWSQLQPMLPDLSVNSPIFITFTLVEFVAGCARREQRHFQRRKLQVKPPRHYEEATPDAIKFGNKIWLAEQSQSQLLGR